MVGDEHSGLEREGRPMIGRVSPSEGREGLTRGGGRGSSVIEGAACGVGVVSHSERGRERALGTQGANSRRRGCSSCRCR